MYWNNDLRKKAGIELWKTALMTEFRLTGAALWERMNLAVEKVQERLEKNGTDAGGG